MINANPDIYYTQHVFFREKVFTLENYDSLFNNEGYILTTDNWYSEDKIYRPDQKEKILENFALFEKMYPKMHIILLHPVEEYITNWPGFDYIVFNRNALLSPKDFFIIEDSDKKYDTVYNACLYKYKNHNLLPLNFNTCLIFYIRTENITQVKYIDDKEKEYSLKLYDSLKKNPNIFMPNIINGKYSILNRSVINSFYNKSKVGLLLSEVEGICITSMEYLLSGIPIVNVKNNGGRDRFLDSYNSITVNPDKKEIEAAVNEIIYSDYSSEKIRNRAILEINKEFEILEEQLKIKIKEFKKIDFLSFRQNLCNSLDKYVKDCFL